MFYIKLRKIIKKIIIAVIFVNYRNIQKMEREEEWKQKIEKEMILTTTSIELPIEIFISACKLCSFLEINSILVPYLSM